MTIHATRRLAPAALALVALVATVGGCAQPGTGTGPGGEKSAASSYGANDLVLRVEYTGGFVMPEWLLTRVPILSIYGDGRVITEGPVPAIFPGPALPNLQVQMISPDKVVDLAARALSAGVGSGTDLGQPPVADAPNTRFTVLSDQGPQVTEVNALDIAESDSGLTKAQQDGRKALRTLIDDLTNLPATVGPEATESKPYQADEVAVISRPWTDPGTPEGQQPEKAWPGPALPGAPADQVGLSCVTLAGQDAAAVLAEAASANALTPWTSEGQRWSVSFRPLLPDESSCDDLR
jgi:hypothetical protein